MAAYRYPSFSTSTQIRLLNLLPGGEDSDLQAELALTDLASLTYHKYEAISYTWGTTLDEQVISLGGVPVKIRYNLWSALKRLRSTSGEPRRLWCDALCISQDDLKEKSEQVRMIGTIFTKAESVLVWVGEHADGSDALFKKRLRSRGRTREAQKKHFRTTRVSMVAEWSAFLNRPYWNRAWIIQEIILARSIVVFCGCDQIDWDDLVPTWAKIWGALDYLKLKPVSEDFRKTCVRFRHLNVERTMHQAERLFHRIDFYVFPTLNESILGVSNKFGETNCTDPRDKIYAFLALERQPSLLRGYLEKTFPMNEISEIYPDYEISTVDLFIQMSNSRLIWGHTPRRATSYLASLFRNLQLDQRDARKVVDFLLKASDDANIRKAVFRSIAFALDEVGVFGVTSIRSRGCQARSIVSIRKVLEEWRDGQTLALPQG